MPTSSPWAPADGCSVARRMPVIVQRACSSSHRAAEHALHLVLVLVGVQVAEAGQAGHLVVELRVVLHRARAQRVEAQVDGVVQLREPGVVAHHLRLGELGQRGRRRAQGASGQEVGQPGGVATPAAGRSAPRWPGLLFSKMGGSVGSAEVGPGASTGIGAAGGFGAAVRSWPPPPRGRPEPRRGSASRSAGVFISVTATSRQSSSAGSKRPRGTPGSTPRARMAARKSVGGAWAAAGRTRGRRGRVHRAARTPGEARSARRRR